MPTKKQRRRQQKSRRHDYEYVYIDDEGNEVAVEPTELRAEKETKKTEARSRNGTGARAGGQPRAGQRAINPPSWRRAVKRAVIFGPVIVIGMMLLNRNQSLVRWLPSTVILVTFLIPITYYTDAMAYRMYRKRLARSNARKAR